MMDRQDLRLAVCVGLAAGFGSISTVPDGYYLPLTLAAVMVGSYGGSYALGLQRVICTLLGGLLLLIAQPAFTGLPFPIGLALMLGLIRFLGGCLGLEAGYKITGMVVVMGWLMQSTAVDSWLGLKLSWTALGVVLALLALHLLWPSTAIREHQQAYVALLELQREALLEQQRLLDQSAGVRLSPARRKQRHRELMRALIQARATRPAAQLELGANPYAQPQLHVWTELERCCAAIAGCITALRALREPFVGLPALRELHQAEAQLLADAFALLGLWQDALTRHRPVLVSDSTSEDLSASIEQLRGVERDLLAQMELPEALDPLEQKQVARRLLLSYQIGALVQRMQLRWQELMVTSKDPLPTPR